VMRSGVREIQVRSPLTGCNARSQSRRRNRPGERLPGAGSGQLMTRRKGRDRSRLGRGGIVPFRHNSLGLSGAHARSRAASGTGAARAAPVFFDSRRGRADTRPQGARATSKGTDA
jgi:hypothetical protein